MSDPRTDFFASGAASGDPRTDFFASGAAAAPQANASDDARTAYFASNGQNTGVSAGGSTAASSETPEPQETAGRIAGVAARGAATGGAGLAALPLRGAQAVAHLPFIVENAVRRAIGAPEIQDIAGGYPSAAGTQAGPYKPQLSDFVHPEKWQEAAHYFADKAGLPQAQTPTERIVQKGAEALPSAVLAPEAPIAGALWSAAGGATSQAAAEAGYGPVAQTVAGLTAGGLPAIGAGAAGGVRAITRGVGESAGAAVAARQAAAEASGTSLTAGQATGSKLLQKVESLSGNMWGSGPIHAAAETQANTLGEHVDGIVKNLSQGEETTPTTAGAAMNRGAADTRAAMKQAEAEAYGKVEALVSPQQPISVKSTLDKLNELAAPTPGAEATTGALVSPTIAKLRENLAADVEQNGGTLPYSAARQLRSAIGNQISPLPSDPAANRALKQLYGMLSDDLRAGASAVSPEAQTAAGSADALYKANVARREALDSIVDKAGGPEAVYQAATSGLKNGATKISTVMSAMNPDQQKLLQATVINRLGRAAAGQQSAEGDVFNPSTFLGNWSKIAPEAKDALFGRSGNPGDLRSGLDSLTKTLETLRNSQALRNPSGTGAVLGHLAGVGEIGGAVWSLLTGHPAAAAALAGTTVGNAVLSRWLVNPKTVKLLAETTKLPGSTPAVVASQLGRGTDEE